MNLQKYKIILTYTKKVFQASPSDYSDYSDYSEYSDYSDYSDLSNSSNPPTCHFVISFFRSQVSHCYVEIVFGIFVGPTLGIEVSVLMAAMGGQLYYLA